MITKIMNVSELEDCWSAYRATENCHKCARFRHKFDTLISEDELPPEKLVDELLKMSCKTQISTTIKLELISVARYRMNRIQYPE